MGPTWIPQIDNFGLVQLLKFQSFVSAFVANLLSEYKD